MRYFISILYCFFLFSCSKKNISTAPYIGNMEIDSTMTIKTIQVGQNITSKVKLVIPSLSGETKFIGFDIVENPVKTYAVKAKAIYKPWGDLVTLPVYQTFDTTLTISTSITGLHILNFYNGSLLLKSDTVQVN